ncbi:TPA: hypothetical protein ACFOCK_002055, partial [Neisseria meningitidis]
IQGRLRGYLGKIRRYLGRKQPKTCVGVSAVSEKVKRGTLQRSQPEYVNQISDKLGEFFGRTLK